MALPPNLVIFNSNKKMVQLSKVVSNLTFTLDTCMFQITTFEERFSKEFQDIFNTHQSIITKINAEVKNHKDKIASENFNMYSENHQKIQEQYYQAVETLTFSVNSEQSKCIEEIEKIKKELSEITIKLNYLESSLSEPLSDIFSSSTKETIPVLKARYQEELRLHDEESEKKFNALKEEMANKIESFDSSYAKAVENLKKQFYITTKDSGKIKIFGELKYKLQVIYQDILRLKETLLGIQKDRNNLLSNQQQGCSIIINEYQKIFSQNSKQIYALNSQFENMISKNSDDLKSINEKIQYLKEKHLQEITDLQSLIARLLLDHKVEIDKKKSLHQSSESLSDEEIQKLKENYQNEFNQVKEKFESQYPSLIEGNKTLQAQLNELLNTFQNEFNDRLAKFNAKKDEYSKEAAKLKDEQDDDSHLEYAKFESKMTILMKKLGQNKSLITDTKCAENTKNELLKELDDLKIQIEKEKNDFDLSFQEEKESLSNQNDSSIKECQDEEEKKLLAFQVKMKGQIDENIKQYEEKKNELILSLKNQYESSLKQIPEKFRTDNVISTMFQEYNQLYKSLQKNLEDEMKEVVYKSNENQLQESISEKEELLSRIENERLRLLSKMASNEEEENKRHTFMLSMLVPSHKEEEIENYRQKCKNRMNTLIQRQDDLLFILRKLKEQSQGQNISVSGYLEDEEVAKLRKLLEELRNDLKNQRHSKQLDFEESIARKNEEIADMTQKIQDYLEKVKIDNENNIKEGKREIEAVKEKAIIDLQEAEKAFCIEKESIKGRITQIQQIIHEKIRQLKEILENERNKKEKNQNDLKVEAEKNQINNHMSLKQTFEKLNVEINMLKEKHEEFIQQYKDQIRIYIEICQKSRKKAENIPMRQEESIEIKRLEGILDQKTQQLTLVAKDLMKYKNRLKQQEDEYNRRFGVSPQVAILGSGDNRRQTKSAAFVKKPLPPLKNSSVC